MKKTIGILLILLSVGLNVTFVTVWIAHRMPQLQGYSCHGGESGCPFHIRLGMTDPQRQEFEARLNRFRESSQPICAEVQRRRLELIDLLAVPTPDRTAIRAKQDAILEGQRRMQERVIENLLEMKATLTPDQQKKLFDMIRERSDCAGHGPMMMGLGTNMPCRP